MLIYELPWMLCAGLLVAFLIVREYQNRRMMENLLDRILENHGLEPVSEHALADLKSEKAKRIVEVLAKRAEQRAQQSVNFKLPQQDVMDAMSKKKRVEPLG